MTSHQVSESELKKGLLVVLISERLNQKVNFDNVLFLLNNINQQISNVLDDKINQSSVINVIEHTRNLGQRKFVVQGDNVPNPTANAQTRNETPSFEVEQENVTTTLPTNIRIDTKKKLQEIEDLRRNSSRIVDYYYSMTNILKDEDKTSLRLYGDLYTDVLSRISLFSAELEKASQNYLTTTFMVNMCLKLIFDNDITGANAQKITTSITKMKELMTSFKENNQVSHTDIINRNIDTAQNVPIIVKFFISIMKRFGNYLEINSTNIKEYEFALTQVTQYIENMEFSINTFGNLSTA